MLTPGSHIPGLLNSRNPFPFLKLHCWRWNCASVLLCNQRKPEHGDGLCRAGMTLLCRGLMRWNSFNACQVLFWALDEGAEEVPGLGGGWAICSACDLAPLSPPLWGWRGKSSRILESTAKWNVKFGLIKKDYVAGITNCKFPWTSFNGRLSYCKALAWSEWLPLF